jgi:anti-anti-sigma factor
VESHPLTIRAFEESDRHVLVIEGELDLSGVPAFEAAASQLCQLGARHLLVDISGVDFIDSTGLRAILAVKSTCEEHGCGFSMTHGSGQAERLFELTRLVDRLPFRKSGQTRPRTEIELRAPSAGREEDEPQASV